MTDDKQLIQHLFGKSALAEVEEDRLRQMSREYPYFPHVYWMLAAGSRKTGEAAQTGGRVGEDVRRAAAYAFHPLRLQQYLPQGAGADHGAAAVDVLSPEASSAEQPQADMEMIIQENESGSASPLIQPLFTRDYFAYTGARLPEHIENDKRPTMEQLHSFTDWLRTLKRPKGTPDPDLEKDEASRAARDESEHAGIRKSAEASVKTEEDVYTEAMAEVREAKGQTGKAIAIYEKLSLSNPEKSAYFAQKIEALKNK